MDSYAIIQVNMIINNQQILSLYNDIVIEDKKKLNIQTFIICLQCIYSEGVNIHYLRNILLKNNVYNLEDIFIECDALYQNIFIFTNITNNLPDQAIEELYKHNLLENVYKISFENFFSIVEK